VEREEAGKRGKGTTDHSFFLCCFFSTMNCTYTHTCIRCNSGTAWEFYGIG
jgi:hypothetical protein